MVPDRRTLRGIFVRVGAGAIAIWYVCRQAPVQTAAQWSGLTLAVLGLIGILVAQLTLGSSFSITPQARRLVTRGIYSRLRNPIYVFGTILIAGLILIIQKPRFWFGLIALVVMQIFRARAESKVLEAKFGEEYRRYRQQTWF